MNITDVFIRRPVLSCVVSLVVFLVGIGGLFALPVRQFPALKNTVIVVNTAFPGADAATIKSFITEPIQQAISSVAGIDYIESSSAQGVSTVSAHMALNANVNEALTDMTGKVGSVVSRLPEGSKSPSISKQTGADFPLLILAFNDEQMSSQQVTAYIKQVVSPKLVNVDGVAGVDVWGGDEYAMRIWLNPEYMAMYQISPTDIMQVLQASNVQAQAGKVEGTLQAIPISGGMALHNINDFKHLPIKKYGDHTVVLSDVAKVELGVLNDHHMVLYNGKRAQFTAISLMPDANPLVTIKRVLHALPSLRESMPTGMTVHTVYDATIYISSALHEVLLTLGIAVAIVVVVIVCCLGSWRAVLIPVIAIPLSLIGVCFLMYLLGFSLNLLTFLAMVLAIGLVVDDAIVVVENIHRYLEQGESPFNAAIKGAREIAGPIVVMTLTLAAVFAPIGFVSGITGTLFREFAFALAASVVISGVVALTLSPMLCMVMLNQQSLHSRFSRLIDHSFSRLQSMYETLLKSVMRCRVVVIVIALLVVINIAVFYMLTPNELAPQEDQGFLGVIGMAPGGANLNYLKKYNAPLGNVIDTLKDDLQASFIVAGHPEGSIMGGLILKPWSKRLHSQSQIKALLQKDLYALPGLQAFAFEQPALPGTSGNLALNVVLKTTMGFDRLFSAMELLKEGVKSSGLFMYSHANLSFNTPQFMMHVDREKANDLGVSMRDIANAMVLMVGGQGVSRFDMEGYNYEVVPQLDPAYRSTADSLGDIQVRTGSGDMVPLRSMVSYDTRNRPASLKQFQQLNAATLSGALRPGVSMGQALSYIKNFVDQKLPSGFDIDYSGASRQLIQEGHTLLVVSVFSLLLIFLLLAAQYESFRDPLVILLSVPMSLFGALLPLFLGLATVNIYTQIGMITLVGLISKHGILMVSCANGLRQPGRSRQDVIMLAAKQRLRPILMTTAAMVFGVVPLLFATGAGAASRFDLGLVIACGMLVGTALTLFVVPVFYTYLSTNRELSNEIS